MAGEGERKRVTTEMDPKLCFVLMPMTDEFKELYEDVIKPMVKKAGLNCCLLYTSPSPRDRS